MKKEMSKLTHRQGRDGAREREREGGGGREGGRRRERERERDLIIPWAIFLLCLQ